MLEAHKEYVDSSQTKNIQTEKTQYIVFFLGGDMHRMKGPVNGGRNSNGPKVAKFLVG